MCGIAGLVNFSESVRKNALPLMNEVLHHRGPDAKGEHHGQSVSLGHVRLSIIDLSVQANQPMESDNHVLVYNGEVYNFLALKKELQLECSTQSDTEVILKAYEKIGTAIFEKLNGMFALAIYNKKTEEVILARDRVGIKPLYLYQNKDQIAFASELKALQKVDAIQQNLNINPDAVANFFHLGYIPAPQSIYQEITKFPSGNYALINKDGIQYHSYWSVKAQLKANVLSDEAVAKKELDELLNASVKIRLKSDVPFGTFLSGGVDSSLITALAQKNSAQQINTFSIAFEEQSHNEAHYAAKVAEHLGTKHHEFTVSHKEAMDLIPKISDYYDEPYADSSCIPTMMVSKLAREKVKMTLSGDGGDELFMGYGFYNWANRLNKPIVKPFRKAIGKALSFGDLRMRRAALLFDHPKGRAQSHIFSQEQYYFSEQELSKLLKKSSKILPELNLKLEAPRKLSATEQQSFFDIQYYLKDELLTKVDIATMRHSLEDRVPLLDHHIVEFALNLDADLKMKGNDAKYLLKQVLYDYVPKQIFDRPKQGFSIPLGKWLNGELSYLIDEFLSPTALKDSPYLENDYVQKIIQKYRRGESYLYTRVWAMIVFQQWYQNQK